MKVLLANHSDYGGGAANAVSRLYFALLASGSCSPRLRVVRKQSSSSIGYRRYPYSLYTNKFAYLVERFVLNHTHSGPSYSSLRSLSLFPSFFDLEINTCSADIIHLHWVQSEFISIDAIGRILKPLVWTLHDLWPISGTFHYPLGAIDSSSHIERYILSRKLRSWKRPIHFICPSKWMYRQVMSSSFSHNPASVIPNAVPISVFKPGLSDSSRSKLSIPFDRLVISFSAHNLNDSRKGFDLLTELLHVLIQRYDNLHALVIGHNSHPSSYILPCPVTLTGYISDPDHMAQVYQASNIHIVPSRLDNLPQSATEAQSCGIPVLGFDVGGLSDAVSHLETGYLAQPFSIKDLSEGFDYIISHLSKSTQLISSRAHNLWNPSRISSMHNELYQSIKPST